MKRIHFFSIFCIVAGSLFSCKKSNDTSTPAVNWNEELKGTVWAGEFKYTTGVFKELQPFTLVVNSDGTTTWTDMDAPRAGGSWKVDGDKITLTFPNKTVNTAVVSKDNWVNFTNPAVNGFEIASLTRSVAVTQAMLEGNTWSGFYKTDAWSIKCVAGSKADLTRIGKITGLPYQTSGASIKFIVNGGTFTDSFFATFYANLSLTKVFRFYNNGTTSVREIWSGQKQ
ncbi:MAG: hypothetical protein ABIU63_14235 [Chitinophagaceae bacterium]